MPNTKRMEMVAENLIAHFLQRHNILVAKPHFDQEGGDLFAMTTDSEIRFCRIQCKGRTVRPNTDSSVKISHELDLENLVVCLFIDDGSFDELNLYVFFKEDIQKWGKSPNCKSHVLSLQHSTFAENLKEQKANEMKIERIANEIMKVQLPTSTHYKYTGSGELGFSATALVNVNKK